MTDKTSVPGLPGNTTAAPERRGQLVMLIAAILLTLAALPGITRLGFNSEVRDIYRSADQQYAAYEDALRLFPGIESEVIVLLGGEVARAETLDVLLQLEGTLNGMPGIERVVSLASLPAVERILLDPFDFTLPDQVSEQQAKVIRQLIATGTPGAGQLTSADGELQVMLVRLSPDRTSPDSYKGLRDDMTRLFERTLPPAGLNYLMAGVPEMKTAVRKEALQDTTRIIAIAVALCTIVAWLLFRSLAVLVTLGIGPALGVVWTLGIMGYSGASMTVFTTILVPLLFVIGYTNAAHILFAVLRGSESDNWQRSGQALGLILNACVVSAITTAIGFVSLALSSSPLVSGFGLYSALGTLLTFLAVIMATPALSVLLGIAGKPPRKVTFWSDLPGRIGGFVANRSLAILVIAIMLVPPAVWLALQLEADYRLRENFPPRADSIAR